MTSPNLHAPAEKVLMGAAVNLIGAGITPDQFIAEAPLCACRLCGALLQTGLHRLLHKYRLDGSISEPALAALELRVIELGRNWRRTHERRNHTVTEIEAFAKTGRAFTDVAAHRLAPFGIIPLGNMSQDVADAMYESPRAPDLTYLQGGE